MSTNNLATILLQSFETIMQLRNNACENKGKYYICIILE